MFISSLFLLEINVLFTLLISIRYGIINSFSHYVAFGKLPSTTFTSLSLEKLSSTSLITNTNFCTCYKFLQLVIQQIDIIIGQDEAGIQVRSICFSYNYSTCQVYYVTL